MASRWSGDGSSDASSSSFLTPVIAAAVALFVGVGGGFLLGKNSAGAAEGTPSTQRSAIAESSTDGMLTAEQNEAGAVKAATSLVVGIPILAADPSGIQASKVAELISADAPATAKQSFTGLLQGVRNVLLGTNRTPTSKVVTTPVSYKSQVNDDGTVTVTVWYTTVMVDPTGPVFRSTWATANIQMRYEDHWRLVSLSNANGPSPDLYSDGGRTGQFNAVQPVLNNAYAYRYALAP